MDLPQHLQHRLDVGLINAPSQFASAIGNAGIVLDLCSDADTLAAFAIVLDDASARIAALRAMIPDAPVVP